MTPLELRSAILADPDTAPYRVTPDMPKDPAYAEKDAAIADILRAKGVGASSRAVPCYLAKKLLIKRLQWLAIVEAASTPGHPARQAAYAAVALAEDARMDADFMDEAAGPLLSALVAAGLIDEEAKQALQAMSFVPSDITAEHVSRALRGPWET